MSKASVSGGTDGLYDAVIEMKDGTPFSSPVHCADLTEDLSGNVGILEIAGALDKGFNIQPGHDGNAAYDAARDGAMKQVQEFPKTAPPGEVYWNWAMRAGWQKWKPNYRYGTISNIKTDANTCNVTLDPCFATDVPDGVQMDINQSSGLSGVSIEYMDCDSYAFSDGDRVIVKFENNDWGSPKVIGFESKPKGCVWESWDGPGLCKNHDWTIMYANDEAWEERSCPSLPFGSGGIRLNIVEGCLTGSAYPDGWIRAKWTPSDKDQLTNINEMIIKITGVFFDAVSDDGSGPGVSVRIKVNGIFYIFYFVGGWDAPSRKIWLIGDNGGKEQVLTLSDYEIPADATITELSISCKGIEGDSTSFTMDYLNFR